LLTSRVERCAAAIVEGDYALAGVFAPAGYAKTELALLYAGFFDRSAIVDCASTADPSEIDAAVVRLLDAPCGPDAETWQLARSWSSIETSSVVVLDNAERLDDADLRTVLKSLCDARPATGRIFVASAREPGFSLNELSGSGVALTLRKSDLALSVEVLREFALDSNVRGVDLVRIAQASGGWPFVSLLLFRIAEEGRLERPFEFLNQGSWKDLFDWIEANVVAHLTHAELGALLYYTICPDATPDGPASGSAPAPGVAATLQKHLHVLDTGFVGDYRVPVILQCHLHARHRPRLLETAAIAAENFAAAGDRVRAARAFVNAGQFELAGAVLPRIDEASATLANYAYPSLVLETMGAVPPPYALYPAIWIGLLPVRRFVVATELLVGEADAILDSLALEDGRMLVLAASVSLHATLGNLDAAHERLLELQAYSAPEAAMLADTSEFCIDIAAFRNESARARWKRFGRLLLDNPAAYALTLRLASRAMHRDGEAREGLRVLTAVAWRSRAPIIAAVAAFESACQSWFLGDASEYRRQLRSFLDLTRVYDVPLLRSAASIFRGVEETGDAPHDAHSTARAWIIAAVEQDDAQKRSRYAQRAVRAVLGTPSPWLRAAVRIIASLCVPQRAAEYVAEAKSIAQRYGIATLVEAIEALGSGVNVPGFLRVPLERLRALPAPALPSNEGHALAIDFVSQTIRRGSEIVTVSLGSQALLVFLSLHPGPVARETLIDELWPELDGDSAGNALKVCVHRTRAQLGDVGAIVAEKGSYRLGDAAAASVAAWSRELAALGAVAERGRAALSSAHRAELTAVFERLAARARRWDRWIWFSSQAEAIALALRSIGELLARDALALEKPRRAVEIARAMSAESPFDELAVSLLIEALSMNDGRTMALAEYERFRSYMQSELGTQPSADLQTLIEAKKSA
jgi:DNA-binding SARP family transcriptional activator